MWCLPPRQLLISTTPRCMPRPGHGGCMALHCALHVHGQTAQHLLRCSSIRRCYMTILTSACSLLVVRHQGPSGFRSRMLPAPRADSNPSPLSLHNVSTLPLLPWHGTPTAQHLSDKRSTCVALTMSWTRQVQTFHPRGRSSL